MQFSLDRSLEILENTPVALAAMLHNLDEAWTNAREGDNTWTAKEILAHLIICDETNWLPRVQLLLSDEPDKRFVPVDLAAHFPLAAAHSLPELLDNFITLRKRVLHELRAVHLQDTDWDRTGIHRQLGVISLQQIIATWTVHDLSHTAQIARVMAKQYKEAVGPFAAFLKILNI